MDFFFNLANLWIKCTRESRAWIIITGNNFDSYQIVKDKEQSQSRWASVLLRSISTYHSRAVDLLVLAYDTRGHHRPCIIVLLLFLMRCSGECLAGMRRRNGRRRNSTGLSKRYSTGENQIHGKKVSKKDARRPRGT